MDEKAVRGFLPGGLTNRLMLKEGEANAKSKRKEPVLNQFLRTERLIGKTALDKLAESRVAIFGIGGVGGYVCEALVRSGIGAFDLIDNDQVDLTNLNRQIIATHRTIGRAKVDVMKERMLDINPEVDVRLHSCFFLPENSDEFSFGEYDYIVDAVDTVAAKIEIIMKAQEAGVPVISAMGTGNKMDPGRLQISDIHKTKVCPLARVMRHELKKRGVKKLKVVYSEEEPLRPGGGNVDGDGFSSGGEAGGFRSRPVPGSNAFVPAAAGLMMAAEVIRDLIQ